MNYPQVSIEIFRMALERLGVGVSDEDSATIFCDFKRAFAFVTITAGIVTAWQVKDVCDRLKVDIDDFYHLAMGLDPAKSNNSAGDPGT